MIVGCPKEIKPQEGRVGLLPSGVADLVRAGHTVVVQSNAGVNAGADDKQYKDAGAQIVQTAQEVYSVADMIVKVKEPLPAEYPLIRKNQVLFTYFHFASSRELTEAMIKSGAVCIAYETVEVNRRLPLLEPMSEVAGRMAVQVGMRFLESPQGGPGLLLGGVPGVKPCKVVVIGGGVVGFNAAKIAAGAGADVVIFDKSLERVRYLEDVLPRNCSTRYSCETGINDELPQADLIIGAVLLPGCKAPRIVRREHLAMMKKGAVMVDVAVDHGGCFETTKTTYHDAPTYTVDGIVHYCVANMPGAVPMTSTVALTNATIGFVMELANKGWVASCDSNPALAKGLNVALGKVLHSGVAGAFGMPSEPVEGVLSTKNDTSAKKAAGNVVTA